MPKLFVASGPRQGRSFELSTPVTDIGRRDCTVVVDDDTVSRRHARITQSDGGFDIEDLKSRSGTYVNGVRIHRARLSDGDKIVIGRCELVFQKVDPPPAGEDKEAFTLESYSADGLMDEAVTQAWDPMRVQANLGALYRIGYTIGSTLDPADLVERALAIIISEVKRIDFCSIHLVDEATGDLRCAGQKAREAAFTAQPPTFSKALLQRVTRNMQSVLTGDAQTDERFSDEATPQIRSALCVPLKNRTRLVGVLQAYTLSAHRRLTREDLELLTAAGQLLGAAVESALLYDRLKKEKAALEEANAKLVAAHEKLVQSEKLSAIGQLAAGIMHDIKNPMAVILGYAQGFKYMLKQDPAAEVDRAMLDECLTAVEQGVLHCNAIITDLMQFAKHSAPEMLPARIGELIEGTLKFLSHEMIKAKTDVKVEIEPGLPAVTMDENQIKQVLINIIINALQAMESGGRLRISARREIQAGVDVLLLAVSDNGAGMTEDVKRKIFDPFFSTKKQGASMGGTGLGLSVSYGIIQGHGGDIDVASEPGKGTTFTIRLPVNGNVTQASGL